MSVAVRPGGCLAALLACAFLGGCAAGGRLLEAVPDAALPPAVELTSTPFFPQSAYQCGPAALATVLTAAGVPTTPEALVPQVYLPGRRGSLQVELVAAARQHDRLAYLLEPALPALLREVAAGRPVLVLQNLGRSWLPVWHFAVLIGFDRDTDTVVLRSGTTARLAVSARRFLASWERAGRWALVLLEPGGVPEQVDAGRYLEAAAALEATGRLDAAAAAYHQGASRWPGSPLPHLGLANIAHARGDLAAALAGYDAALLRDPRHVVARNNRAETLAAMGCPEAARREIVHALDLAQDTPFASAVAGTAARLARLPGDEAATCPVR